MAFMTVQSVAIADWFRDIADRIESGEEVVERCIIISESDNNSFSIRANGYNDPIRIVGVMEVAKSHVLS